MKLHLSSLLIGVRSLQKAKLFYENVFGITFDEFRPPFARFTLDGVEFTVEEDSPQREEGWVEHAIGGRKSMNFQTDDLEVFLHAAKLQGAKIIASPRNTPWGWIEAVIADPDGNEFLVEQEG